MAKEILKPEQKLTDAKQSETSNPQPKVPLLLIAEAKAEKTTKANRPAWALTETAAEVLQHR